MVTELFFFFLTREARNSKLSVKRPLILKGAQTLTWASSGELQLPRATSCHFDPLAWTLFLFIILGFSGRRQVTAVSCGRKNMWKWEQASSHRAFGLPGETDSNKKKKNNPLVNQQLQVESTTPKVVTPSCKSLWKRNWPRLGGPRERGTILYWDPVTRLNRIEEQASEAGAETVRGSRWRESREVASIRGWHVGPCWPN